MENILFYNGEVITVDGEDRICEAVWIRGKTIERVGSNDIEEEIKLLGEDYKKIDLKGRTMTPGLIDAHTHIAVSGVPADDKIDLGENSGVDSIEKVLELVKEAVAKAKPGEWIEGQGYNESYFKEGRYIDRFDLDKVSPNNPVLLRRACGHIISFNTLALERGHYFDGEEAYPETHIFRNEDGEVTGVFNDAAAQILQKYVDIEVDEDDMVERMIAYSRSVMASYGITSTHDAGLNGGQAFRVMQKAAKTRELTYRQYPMIFTLFGNEAQVNTVNTAIEGGFFTGLGDEHIKIGPIKIMIDGSTSGPTPAMREPYDGGNNNPLSFKVEDIEDIVIRSHKAGFQVTAHAVGDKAVETMLNAFEKAQDLYPREDTRHRIEHCAFTPNDLVEKIKKLGVIPIANPGFISVYGDIYNRAYGDRVENMFAQRTFKEKGIISAVGSDFTVTDGNPIRSLHGMLYRKHWGTGEIVAEDQSISMLDAIRNFTYNGAYASFEEDIKGSIEGGKLADLAIFSRSILDCTEDELLDSKVDMTVFDGKIVYRRK